MADERRTLTFVGAAIWTVGTALVVELAVNITDVARPGAALDLVSVTMCHVLAYSAIALAMLRVYAPETPVRRVIAFRAVPIAVLVLAVVIGAGLYPAASFVDDVVSKRFPSSPEMTDALEKLMSSATVARRIFLGAALVVIMPAIEEVYFRGILFGGLRRGRTSGMVIMGTAIYFAIARADLRSFASVLALGIVLGWMRDRTRSILPTMLAQAAFFAVPVIPILRGRDPMADETFSRLWLFGGIGAAVLAAVGLEALSRTWAAAADDPNDEA